MMADDGFGGNVGLVIGQKTLHENDFGDIKTQIGFQLMSSWGKKAWPAWIAFDLGYNSGSKNGVSSTETEISLGARKAFMLADVPIVPYVGLGVEYGLGSGKYGGEKVSTSGPGIWIDGGAQYLVGQIGAGLDVRYDSCPSSGKVQGQTIKVDLGGFMIGLAGSYTF